MNHITCFVNDCSVHQQFRDTGHFRSALRELLACRDIAQRFSRTLYVHARALGQTKPMASAEDFRQVLSKLGDQNLERAFKTWLQKNGPFVETAQIHDSGEYYSWADRIVTDTGLAEAAARSFGGEAVALVSLNAHCQTNPELPTARVEVKCEESPLSVVWHHDDQAQEQIDIENHWIAANFAEYLGHYQTPPQTWDELYRGLAANYPNLTFSPKLTEYTDGHPFNSAVAQRISVLLGVLNRLKASFDTEGKRTPEGEELYDQYFRRANARFTDSSESEKQDPVFRQRMTFALPDGQPIECFWHGKIYSQMFRMHFSYPIEPNNPLYIMYIGPKLTKK